MRRLVERISAVAEHGAVAVGVGCDAQATAEDRDEIVLAAESGARGHFGHRQFGIVEQVDGLHQTPAEDELLQGQSHQQLHGTAQPRQVLHLQKEGDVGGGVCRGSLDIVHHGIDDNFTCGSPIALVELLYGTHCFDFFNHFVGCLLG